MDMHLITVKFLGPTNCRGSRIAITSEYWRGCTALVAGKYRKVIPYNSAGFSPKDQARVWLTHKGYTVLGSGDTSEGSFLVVKEFYSFQPTEQEEA